MQTAALFAGPEAEVYRQGRDVVLLDLRGTGGANPLRCAEIEGLAAGPRTALGEMYPIPGRRGRIGRLTRAEIRAIITAYGAANIGVHP